MTTDVQETIQERMARVRAFRKPKTETQHVAPVQPLPRRNRARTITPEEEVLMRNSGAGQTVERFQDTELSYGEATISHSSPGRVLMWKPLENGGYTPRIVSESAKGLNLQAGWRISCPDCGTNHEDSPYPPGDPNSCPGKAPVAVRICPVCGKRITDNVLVDRTAVLADALDAAMIIRDDYVATTPEVRTRLKLEEHLWVFHPRQARARGVTEIPTALKPIVNVDRPI